MNVAPQAADASNRWKKFLNSINACARVDIVWPSGQIYFDLHNIIIMVKIFDELPFAVR